MSQAMTLNEMEWRADEASASAGKAISTIWDRAHLSVAEFSLLWSMMGLTKSIRTLVLMMHKPEGIAALESASREQRKELGDALSRGHEKIARFIEQMRAADIDPFSSKFFEPRILALDDANKALGSHCQALCDQEAELLVLSRKDERYILDAVFNPKEPSEELRKIFARK